MFLAKFFSFLFQILKEVQVDDDLWDICFSLLIAVKLITEPGASYLNLIV